MKGLSLIFGYYFTWQRLLVWLVRIGLVLIAVSVPASFLSGAFAFGWAIYGFAAAVGIPFAASPWAFRSLISNRRLSLVPGFRLRAGAAWLLMAIPAAVFVPAMAAMTWYVPQIRPPGDSWIRLILANFVLATAYAGVMQAILASRYATAWLSLLPIAAVITIANWGADIFQTMLTPRVNSAIFLLSLLGWAAGLVSLSKGRMGARSPSPIVCDHSGFMLLFDLGFTNRWSIGRGGSAEGMLLLGYPAGRLNAIKRVLDVSVLTPLISALLVYLVGMANDGTSPHGLAEMFLWFSMGCSSFNALNYGELAARSRLLWLKHGGDRALQWSYLERLCLANLGLLYLVAAAIGGIMLWWNAVPGISILGYAAMVVCGSLFCAYFSLAARIRGWSYLMQGVTIVGLLIAIVIGLFMGDYAVTAALGAGLLALAALFRGVAMSGFIRIDWFRIQPFIRGRALHRS